MWLKYVTDNTHVAGCRVFQMYSHTHTSIYTPDIHTHSYKSHHDAHSIPFLTPLSTPSADYLDNVTVAAAGGCGGAGGTT